MESPRRSRRPLCSSPPTTPPTSPASSCTRRAACSSAEPGSGGGGERAAVHHDVGAADPRRVVRGQEEGAARDVLRLPDPAERDLPARGHFVLYPVDDVGGEPCPDGTRADRVHADAVGPV